MAKIEEKKAAPRVVGKPRPQTESEREVSLKGEPFVVASYHLEGGKFVLLDKFGRRLEFAVTSTLKA